MSAFHLLILVVMFIILMVFVPVGAALLLHKKYGSYVDLKVGIAFFIVVIIYVALMLSQGPRLIPDSWRPHLTQVYQCEWKTVYVEKK